MSVRIGIIGPGGIGRAHIARISDRLARGRVVAVTDIDPAHAQRVAEPIGAAVYPDDAALIDADDVDAVMVTSFGPAHEGSVVRAIEAGKPVFCEKPLAPTAAECLRIMDAEQRGGRRLVQVGFMRRYDAGYREIKATLERGELGAALIVHNRHHNPHSPQTYLEGMSITDTAIHEIDVMRFLLGEEIVSARVDKPKRTTSAFAHLSDPLMLVLRTASDVLIDVEIFVNNTYGYDIKCEVVGERGLIALSDQNATVRTSPTGRGNRIAADYNERFEAAFETELQEWIDSVQAGEIVGPTSWDGYAAAVVCDAGVRSLRAHGSQEFTVDLIEKPAFYA
ncbi:Gfo/Idh/MocA family oxidoreductase [Occultella glacieicola]|uniref:Inositol 2-dehydrogenase n=1 Tax=Occultella glacieicola TaxID=2518684 RepID=A0ABY2E2K7_9MICO|nr:Gfo/Idh/MocA family oxidoreductase [Occultella glacieicola]TDE92696.1 Gfo/Idh/MocA family oxidoreductase [Occultella glacieicola]